MTKQLRQTIIPQFLLGAAGSTEADALGYFSLIAGTGITLTSANGSLTVAATNAGTVTSVTGTSPVTSSGGATPAIALASGYGDTQNPWLAKTANTILAGPATGANAVPAFRTLVPTDIPALDASILSTGTVPIARGGTGAGTLSGARTALTINNVDNTSDLAKPVSTATQSALDLKANLASPTFTGTPAAPTATAGTNTTQVATTAFVATAITGLGSGTVTSVGLSLPNLFTVSGSPVTSTGTLTAALATQAANQVLIGPTTGANAAPTFRALVAGDLPSHSTDLLTSGILPSARGGTGQSTYTNGQILIGKTDGTLTKSTLTAGTGISVTNADGAITIATSGVGTVTSVTGTSPVSVATGTSTPVISLASGYGDTQNPYASKTANFVLAAPNGSAGVPTFRTLVTADVSGFDTQVRTSRLDQMAAPTAPVAFNSQRITNLADPTSAQDAATRAYADANYAPILLTEGTAQTGSYTLALTDLGRVVLFNSASAANLTVPPNSSVAFSIGAVLYVYNNGAGAISLVAGSGVTLRNATGTLAQYKEISLRKRATDEWVVTGL